MTDINQLLDLDQKPILSDSERDHLREMALTLLTADGPQDGVALFVADDFVQVLGLVIAAGLEALE